MVLHQTVEKMAEQMYKNKSWVEVVGMEWKRAWNSSACVQSLGLELIQRVKKYLSLAILCVFLFFPLMLLFKLGRWLNYESY